MADTPDPDVLEALQMRSKGHTVEEIANEVCVSTTTVSKWCIKHGLRSKDKLSGEERLRMREEATRLRKLGYSYSDLQKELGLSKSTLSVWLSGLELSPEARTRIAAKQEGSRTALILHNTRRRKARGS